MTRTYAYTIPSCCLSLLICILTFDECCVTLVCCVMLYICYILYHNVVLMLLYIRTDVDFDVVLILILLC